MQKYEVNDDGLYECEDTQGAIVVYLASDVDAELASKRDTLDAAVEGIAQRDKRIAELEKALRRLIKAVELFDNETDGGLSEWDPAVTDAEELLGPTT